MVSTPRKGKENIKINAIDLGKAKYSKRKANNIGKIIKILNKNIR